MNSKKRGHGQHEIKHVCDMVDYISNLPDSILHHILSFMPTVEAVQTSIISSRWKNLWASIPNIYLDDDVDDLSCVKTSFNFKNFVQRVLQLRDKSNITKFCLTCLVFEDASVIHSWISYAIMHNVEELDLLLAEIDPSAVPACVFNNTSLDTLKIQMHWVHLPSHVSLPCLKTLHLSVFEFPDDDYYADKLFSGCPVLEDLVLTDCVWDYLENVVISSSSLKSLTINDQSYTMFGSHDELGGCKIKINAANLSYFEYRGYLSNGILLNDASSVVKACIDILPPPIWEKEVACRAVDLLRRLQYVVSLRLSICTMKTLLCADNMPIYFPVFSNLIHLVLTKEIKCYAFGAVMNLLYFCPILQSICLHEGFEECMDLVKNHRLWLLVPVCVSNCLNTVTFNNFLAKDSEICFLKRVLHYARVLERMDICWSKTRVLDLKKQRKVRKELETIERGSITCVIKFS